jgi:predicted ArsR family transcriptional regulator
MMGDWTFFSNYGHVLVCLARNREVRLRDVAADVGITERAVQKIVRDLHDAGYLTISKQGRCNRYQINRRKTLRHDLESHCTVGKMLTLMARPGRVAPVALPEQQPAEPAQETYPAPLTKPAVEASKPVKKEEVVKSKKRKKDKDSRPLDTRQQGNLF